MKKTWIWIVSIVVVAVIVVFAVIQIRQQNTETKKIKVGYLPMVSSLTYFVASEKGFYKEENLEVEANPIQTSNSIAQDLIAGHINAAIELSIVPLLKQLEASPNTAKIFSISDITSENGFDSVLVKNNSPLSKLEDLSGKKVGVFPGTTAKNCFAVLFKEKFPGLPVPVFIEIDPSLHLQSLERGDVDAIHTYEPALTLGIVKNRFKKIFTSIYAAQYSPCPIGVAAVNVQWLTNNTETARAFFRATDKAVNFIKNNPNEARQILTKATTLDAESANAMNIMPMSLSTNINFENLKGYLDVLKNIGEIKLVPSPQDICIN